MSSVTRFIRQVPTGLSFYSLPALSAIYEFVPSSANTVGNYPPGAMVQAANSSTLSTALQVSGAAYAGGSPQAGYLLRDMGKTVYAQVASSESAAGTGIFQHFRMVQIIKPSADGSSGIQGASTVPNSFTDYLTVYVPITVTAGGSLLSSAQALIGGQM